MLNMWMQNWRRNLRFPLTQRNPEFSSHVRNLSPPRNQAHVSTWRLLLASFLISELSGAANQRRTLSAVWFEQIIINF